MTTTKNTFFLVTGMARSGTTLVDKILDSHSNIRAISQPLPKLYRHIKRAFFKEIGISEDYYVLNNLFNNDQYTRKQFLDFLENYIISTEELKHVFEKMEGWSGQLTTFNYSKLIEKHKPCKLIDFYNFFICELNHYSGITALGTKEILVEEFVEYFLKKGVKIILIIRDPRDVFTSLNVGSGIEYGGKHRPTLFHLRNWRKSVAIANTFKEDENCLVLKYEDVLGDYENELKEVTDFLNVSNFPEKFFNEGIRGKDKVIWKGNSSTSLHKGIVSTNKNKFKKYLNESTIAYIEYICKAEMLALNYQIITENYDPTTYNEPFEIHECGLNPLMSSSVEELQIENERIKILEGKKTSNEKLIQMFYSINNYEKLKDAFNNLN